MLTIREMYNARTEQSLLDTVNHNCVINDVTLHEKYGVIFKMYKLSTGATFNIDIESIDSHCLILSEGIGYERFQVPAHKVFRYLRPSVRKAMVELWEMYHSDETTDTDCVPDGYANQLVEQNSPTLSSAFTLDFIDNYTREGIVVDRMSGTWSDQRTREEKIQQGVIKRFLSPEEEKLVIE